MLVIPRFYPLCALLLVAGIGQATPQVPGASQAPAPATTTSAQPESLNALLEELRLKHQLPALGAAVVRKGQVVAIGVCGERARGSGVLVTVDDRWHLGSCTKAMTATLAARLVDQGKLEWSQTVGRAFPDWSETIHEGWRDTRLDQLLQNRGGAPGQPPQALWAQLWKRSDAPSTARRWFVQELLKQAPSKPAGTAFEYSNQGFVIAGAMLEQAGGATWEELLRTQVFEPLEMKHSGFGPPGSAEKIDQPRGHRDQAIAPGPAADNPAALGPAGTVHATLGDWARFAAAHASQTSLLKPESWRKLHQAPEGAEYAMGWGVVERSWAGGTALTHSGSNTLWYCTLWIAPAKEYAVMVTTNVGTGKVSQACDQVIGAVMKQCGP